MWIARSLEEDLLRASKTRPAILLTGARQTGKSSLLKKLFSQLPYQTLDRPAVAQAAIEAPDAFLNQLGMPVILDEVQYAPSLFRELKPRIDTSRVNGSYILTGSQRYALMQGVSESLAGRIRVLELGTLSALELRSANFYSNEFLCRGGYPELWSNPALRADEFFEDYVATYLERDLNHVLNVANLRDFRRFILACAARAGQLLNYTELARDVGITGHTAKTWVNALDASGLIYILPPYHANVGKRLIKAPKLYFADHGLLCHLLNIKTVSAWNEHSMRGALWENIVLCEYVKVRKLRPGYDLFFYRDQNSVEIDFVIEADGGVELIEAKSAERPEAKKLNFSKVAPLFSNKKVKAVVACMTQEERALQMKEYRVLNPLRHDVG